MHSQVCRLTFLIESGENRQRIDGNDGVKQRGMRRKNANEMKERRAMREDDK